MAMDTVMATAMNNKIPSTYQIKITGFVILLFSTTTAIAQQGISRSTEGSTSGRVWFVTPRISLTETLTDNVNINQSSNGKQSDLISELSPGIRIGAHSARLSAHLDYALRKQFYGKNTDQNRSQNTLNTFGTFEAVDNWMFLDFSGIIAQQSISAFGTQSPNGTSINSNSTETATYRLSPHIRGQLGGVVDYSLRYNISTTNSRASNVSDVDFSKWTGQLNGSTPFQRLQWSIDASRQTTDYSTGRKTDAETFRSNLTYSFHPQFRATLSHGKESSNYRSQDQESNPTTGYGFDWTPTERTKFSAFKEKRFFGHGHKLSLSHRFPMSSIQISDSKDISVLPNQFNSIGLGSIYDLYFEQFSSLIPDPVARANFVNGLLTQSGINPNARATSDFLTSQATVRRNQQLSLVIFGARNTITAQISRGESQGTQQSQPTIDPISQSSAVKQQGFSLNLSHRLSELSNLNLLGSRQESTGNGSAAAKTTTTLYQINLSTKLGAKTTGSISARRSEFDGSTNPYTENALLATVSFIY
jgi:uncharacterized protein (PEP-CTERM system associated)